MPAPRRSEQPYATGSAIVVEHDAARLDYDGRLYRLTMRRLLRNTGTDPITHYLIRISVDRYPGDPERSNADHLDGHLYLHRMRPGVAPIFVELYRQTGRSWAYDS